MYLFKHLLLLIDLLKGKGHKYLKRVPVGVDKKTGRTRYRYVYNVTHKVGGKHIDDHDNMKANSKYMWHSEEGEEVHVHVKKVNKDGSLVLMYDDGEKAGEEFTISKKDLAKKLREEHNIEEKFKEKIKKVKHDLAMAKKHGTKKQIRRLEKELASLKREGVKKPVDKEKDLSNTEKDDSSVESTKEQETSNTEKEQAMSNKPQVSILFEEYKKEVKEAQEEAKLDGGKMDTVKFMKLYRPIEAKFKPAFNKFANDTGFLRRHTDLLHNFELDLHKVTLQDWGYTEGFKALSDYVKEYGFDIDNLQEVLDEDENYLAEWTFREQGEFKTFENPNVHLENLEKLMAVYTIDHLSQNAYADKDLSFLSLSDMERLVNKYGKRFKKLKGYLKEREASDIDLAMKEIERRKQEPVEGTPAPELHKDASDVVAWLTRKATGDRSVTRPDLSLKEMQTLLEQNKDLIHPDSLAIAKDEIEDTLKYTPTFEPPVDSSVRALKQTITNALKSKYPYKQTYAVYTKEEFKRAYENESYTKETVPLSKLNLKDKVGQDIVIVVDREVKYGRSYDYSHSEVLFNINDKPAIVQTDMTTPELENYLKEEAPVEPTGKKVPTQPAKTTSGLREYTEQELEKASFTELKEMEQTLSTSHSRLVEETPSKELELDRQMIKQSKFFRSARIKKQKETRDLLSNAFNYTRYLQGDVSKEEIETESIESREDAKKTFDEVLKKVDVKEADAIIEAHDEEEERLTRRNGTKERGSQFNRGLEQDKDDNDLRLDQYQDILKELERRKS